MKALVTSCGAVLVCAALSCMSALQTHAQTTEDPALSPEEMSESPVRSPDAVAPDPVLSPEEMTEPDVPEAN